MTEMDGHPASAEETIEFLLKGSGRRGFVPFRREFVQSGPQNKPVPGPAAELLRRHDETAFDLYLLHHALATAPPYDVKRHSLVWARALSLGNGRAGGVSQAWSRLVNTYKLVSKEREGRLVKVTSLREDGSGHPYTRPGKAGDRSEVYLRLPLDYWIKGWHVKLGHAAKTMLLIAASLPGDFILPLERSKAWYGISADSAGRGMTELRRHRLVISRRQVKSAPGAPLGFAVVERYTLQSPFIHLRGRQLQLVQGAA